MGIFYTKLCERSVKLKNECAVAQVLSIVEKFMAFFCLMRRFMEANIVQSPLTYAFASAFKRLDFLEAF